MKRRLAYALAAVILLSAVSGCSKSDREEELLAEIERLEAEIDELKNGGKSDNGSVAPTDFSEFEQLVDKGLILVKVGVITDCAESITGDIAIPDYIAEIGEFAFSNCDKIESVYVSGSTERIGLSAFGRCTGLTSVTIDSGVTTISQSAFSQCSNITELVIPDTVNDIYGAAFYGCEGLTDVELLGIEYIGELAFADCTSLTNVSIGDSIRSIDERAFEDCTSLTNVTYNGVTYSYENIDELYDAINSD